MDKSIVRTRRGKALAIETAADALDNSEDNDIGDIIDESKLESAAAGWFEPLDIPKNFTSVNEIQQILAPLFQPNVSSTSMTQFKKLSLVFILLFGPLGTSHDYLFIPLSNLSHQFVM